MIEEQIGQDIRVCGAPGCDNPIGNDTRRRHCSRRCSNKVGNERARQRIIEKRGMKRLSRVCAIEGCENPVHPPRRRHCSAHCAAKAQREQVRKTSEINRKKRSSSSKLKPRRQQQEIRAIRYMQHVPAERWDRYEFIKKGITQ